MITTGEIASISLYLTLLFMFIAIYSIKYFENGRIKLFLKTYIFKRWGFMEFLFFSFGFGFMQVARNTDVCLGITIICGLIIVVYMMGMEHFLNRDLKATRNVVDITKIT